VDFLQRLKAHVRVELPGPGVGGVRLRRAEGLDLEQFHPVFDQIVL
jgi:hypothetical protein